MKRATLHCSVLGLCSSLGLCSALWLSSALAQGWRDPTQPPQAAHSIPAQREITPVLTAVLSANGRRTAIVNGQLVRGAGSVDAFVIEMVLADGIRYRRIGRPGHASSTQELHLPRVSSHFKTPTTALTRASTGVQ